jgi:protein-disulfide isomerase
MSKAILGVATVALIGAGVFYYTQNNDVSLSPEGLKGDISASINTASETARDIVANVSEGAEALVDEASNSAQGIVAQGEDVVNGIDEFANNAVDSGANVVNEAAEATESVAETVVETTETVVEEAQTAVSEITNPRLGERFIGDVDAPVVIEEFSSFTCPHCATFHNNNMEAIKAALVDTGKVRFVYRDYPLNKPALDAAVMARCVPEGEYYDFITVLFKTQDEWAFDGDPNKLIQTAKLAGLTQEEIDSCIEDRDVVKYILGGVQQASAEYEVKSTPTFIFNGGAERIIGSRPVGDFEVIVNRLIAEQGESTAE